MRSIRVRKASENTDNLDYDLVKIDLPKLAEGECLIEVHASSVNPSDVKAILGVMPDLKWPRTPGRNYSGIVVDGDTKLIGKEVWGTGGDLGMSRDGSHAEYIIVEAGSVREKPANISMFEAATIGVSWTCAWLGMVRGVNVRKGQKVVVLGANGNVGQASIQLASAVGAQVIAVERSRKDYIGYTSSPVDVVNLSEEEDLLEAIMNRTNGSGADIIMNSVGSPYFEVASKCLASEGAQIIISTFQEENTINLKSFYRGNYKLVGVSNLAYDHVASAGMMDAIFHGFVAGNYRPYSIVDDNKFTLDRVGEAYEVGLKGVTRDQVLVVPKK